MKILALIPAYNCEKKVGKVIAGLKNLNLITEILVVDDGSQDKTLEAAKASGAKVIQHQLNQGLGGALKTGFAYGVKNNFDVVVTLDADGQHSPEETKDLLAKMQEKNVDMVIGSRLVDKTQWNKFPRHRLLGNLFLSSLTNFVSGKEGTTDSQSGYRAIKRKVLEKIRLRENRMAVSSEIIVEAAKKGFKIADSPIVATYEDEISNVKIVKDTSKIFWMLLKKFLS